MIIKTSFMNQNFTFKANQDKKSNSISNPNNGITVHSYGKDGFECSYERDGIKYTYYMISTPANKKKINRIKELTNQSEDGTVRLIDKEGNVTTLSRPCSFDEIKLASSKFLYKNEHMKNFIDIIDSGVKPAQAFNIITAPKGVEMFKALTTSQEDGSAKITVNDTDYTLSRPLKPQEAALVITSKNKKLPAHAFQTFLDLIDNKGLTIEQAFKIARLESATSKFLSLTNEEEISPYLTRPLTSEEAVVAIEINENKLPSFQKLLDMQLDIAEAIHITKDERRCEKFLKLVEPNEKGEVDIVLHDGSILTLPRALDVNEAIIAIHENFSNKKIYDQLVTDGHIHSTKRRYDRWV